VQEHALRTRPAVLAWVADRDLLLVVGLITLAAGLRFSTLDLQSFWHDEAVTVDRVLKPNFGDMLGTIGWSESTPPLYYVLAWGWSKLFGTGEVGLRSLSAVLGTATVPVAFAAGAELTTRRVGLAAAALVAVNPMLVWYSQEARAYALLILLTCLSFLFFARALAEPGARTLSCWAITSALALATHYFAVFLVAPEAVWLLLRAADRRRVAIAAAAVAAVGAALVPLAVHQSNKGRTDWIGHHDFVSRVVWVPKQFLTGPTGDRVAPLALAAAALAAAGAYLLLTRTDSRERRGAIVAGVCGGLVLVIPLLIALGGRDYVVPRNLLAALGPLAVCLAIGFGSQRAGRVGLAAAGALCTASIGLVLAVDLAPRLQRADWRGVARELGRPDGPRAIVAPHLGGDPFELYLPATGLMPRAGARVREVALVGWVPTATLARQGPAGFRLLTLRRVGTLRLARFVAPRPVAVRRTALVKARIGAAHDIALKQTPR
jgi:mannosyltransferase